VVELLLKSPAEDGPIRALKGFRRISLAADALIQVQFSLTPRDLSSIGQDGTLAVLPGQYELSVGGSQPGDSGGVLEGKFVVKGKQALPK
jgi:beta-glucosidase